MDVNGVTFWMLADGRQFNLADSQAVWDGHHRVLRLRSERQLPSLPTDREIARILANQKPATLDEFGTFATLSADRSQVLAAGVLETTVPIFTAAEGQQVLDLCMGEDGVLYLVAGIADTASAVVMVDAAT